jgi:2-oxoglutarate ferredoxin oxidoreductase subunit beta
LLRRNFDVNILLFNNQIYGLTKGQYSPTSEEKKITKSTPMGSIDHPFNPAALALGADATFVARTMDRDPKHLQAMLLRANAHKGASFLEIYQNCNIFNDGAFEIFTEKGSKATETLFLEQGKPLVFGANNDKGIKLDGFKPIIIDFAQGFSADDCWVHDEKDIYKAQILTRIFDDPQMEGHLPRPFGVFYQTDRPCYEDVMAAQLEEAASRKPADLDKLLKGNEVWLFCVAQYHIPYYGPIHSEGIPDVIFPSIDPGMFLPKYWLPLLMQICHHLLQNTGGVFFYRE